MLTPLIFFNQRLTFKPLRKLFITETSFINTNAAISQESRSHLAI